MKCRMQIDLRVLAEAMFARYYAQRLPGLAEPGSADVLTRVLYRTLLRTSRHIEVAADRGGSYLTPCVTRHVQAVCAIIDVPRTGLRPMSEQCERPSELVRQAFRQLSPSPDKAFAALRCAEEVVSWLDTNIQLHSLATGDHPVEVGACLIADAIESSAAPEGSTPLAPTSMPQLVHVRAALDVLAAQVRAHGTGSSPLELLGQINDVLYGSGNRSDDWGEPFVVEWGDRSDVRLGGSLAHVLETRRGTPLMLCAIHQAVAARLGLGLSFVNFPGHVLLRVGSSGPQGDTWYLDPAANGRRLSSAAVHHALRQLGMHTADDAAWLSAVEPPLVWARILRNVESNYKRQGSIREAWFFRSLGSGLHPEEIKMPEARLDLLGQRLQHIWPSDEQEEGGAEEMGAVP